MPGVWAILTHMYPKANIPIIPLSINYQLPPEAHYELGQKLKTLREQGIMILGSGNVVHNLAIMNWGLKGGYAWADTFDTYIIQQIKKRNHQGVIHYQQAGPSSKMAFYTPEHYNPLLYVLGASDENDEMMVFNDKRIMGAISMTCYLFQ